MPGAVGAGTRVALLGGFGAFVDGAPVPVAANAQRLVAFLALHDRPLHRAYVAGRLWLDVSQDHAHNCLRSTLWRMRVLPCPLIDVTVTHLAIAAGVAVDVRELDESAQRVLQGGQPAPSDVERLVQADDLLLDWYEDWIVDERERLRQIRLLALETACARLVTAGRQSEALVAGIAAVACDPLRESASRVLMVAHGAAGNRAEVVRRFETYRDGLASTLQLEPSPQMLELVRALVSARVA